MERLQSAVEELNSEFNKLVAETSSNIQSFAAAEREQSLTRLEAAQGSNGTLRRAERTRDELRSAIKSYRSFQQKLEQVEQVLLISSELKAVVLDLEQRLG